MTHNALALIIERYTDIPLGQFSLKSESVPLSRVIGEQHVLVGESGIVVLLLIGAAFALWHPALGGHSISSSQAAICFIFAEVQRISCTNSEIGVSHTVRPLHRTVFRAPEKVSNHKKNSSTVETREKAPIGLSFEDSINASI